MGNNDSRLRRIWHNMKTRCLNNNYDKYDRYGGRGISICDEWMNSFKIFEQWALEHGYSDNLTLDRIDNNKGYNPENCRWISRKDQANNRSSSILYTINEITKTLQQWADQYNIAPQSIQRRIRNGWPVESAITTPPDNKYTIKRLYMYNGEIMPIGRISKLANIKDSTLRQRLDKGMSVEEAIKHV